MALTASYLEDSTQWVMTIRTSALTRKARLRAAFSLLDAALVEIEAKIADQEDGAYFYVFDLDPGATVFLRTAKARLREFDPWSDGNTSFWCAVAEERALHVPAIRWLEKLALMLERVDRLTRPTQGTWEYDTTQMGEVPLAALAIADIAFVPIFTRFLELWDFNHEVMVPDVVQKIVEAHGLCPETEDLLATRVLRNFDTGCIENLYPLLEAHYGSFTTSPLFRRMLMAMHANAPDFRDGSGKWWVFSYFPHYPAVPEAANRIFAELDAAG